MEVNPRYQFFKERFKLISDDIGHIFKNSKLQGNSLSPLKDRDYPPTTLASENFNRFLNDYSFQKISETLLEPSLKLRINKAEFGKTEENYFALFDAENSSIVVIPSDIKEDLELLFFDSSASFIAWLLHSKFSTIKNNYESIFPNIMEIEVLLISLQSVDLYRRTFMESMLNYEPEIDLSISTKAFLDYLMKGATSFDKRWLLSALFGLTPGLKNLKFSLNQEHIQQTEDLNFLTSNQNMITLNKKAIGLGEEFLTGFLSSIGVQATYLDNEKEISLSQVFISTTMEINHLLSFEVKESDKVFFKHQPLKDEDLKETIGLWLNALEKTVEGQAANEEVLSEGSNINKDNMIDYAFCHQCGTKLELGTKFCFNCGAPVKREE